MKQPENTPNESTSVEEIQKGWSELKLQVQQATTERQALEAENKALRFLLERLIEHRQRSHGDLVNFLVELISKLPLSDVGLFVSRLVDHNREVAEVSGALLKGKADVTIAKPTLLKDLEARKKALRGAIGPAVEKLLKLDTPLDKTRLESLADDPEQFFSPQTIRANRCFVKGQIPRERIAREFGEEALKFFNDLTTDKRFNPRPKPGEIVLGFQDGFDQQVEADNSLKPEQKQGLLALHQKVQRSKADTAEGRAQKQAFATLCFVLELLRYYEHPNLEAPDVVFAQRLPSVVEQVAGTETATDLEEAAVTRVEELLGLIIKPEHRHMLINNLGKGAGTARTLKHVLALREEQVIDLEHSLAEFVRHLIPTPPHAAPDTASLTRIVGLVPADMQRLLLGSIMSSDRRRRDELTKLGRAVAKELGVKGLEEQEKKSAELPPEMERRMAWDNVKSRILKREDAADVAAAIRDRLHTKYDVEEVKESWLALIEADAVTFVRIFCQLPYLANGKTDPIAHAVMQAYVARLLHEKYSGFYQKIVTCLKNMFKANPQSSTLTNFMAMVKWADADAAERISNDVGMPAHAASPE